MNLQSFRVPKVYEKWEVLIHTLAQDMKEGKRKLAGGDTFALEERSVVVMRGTA